ETPSVCVPPSPKLFVGVFVEVLLLFWNMIAMARSVEPVNVAVAVVVQLATAPPLAAVLSNGVVVAAPLHSSMNPSAYVPAEAGLMITCVIPEAQLGVLQIPEQPVP